MIRLLEEKDRNMLMNFLSIEPSINLFLIGDVEAFGFYSHFQEIWGQFKNNCLEGVLLRFHENFIPYWRQDSFNIKQFKDIILSKKGNIMISGKESIVREFTDILPNSNVKSTYFCELTDRKCLEHNFDGILKADVLDSERIYNFIDNIEEFSAFGNSIDRIRHTLETKTGRIYYIENKDGDIVSVSQSTAENSKSAMIIGVATNRSYRGQGLMSRCLSKLCYDILEEGKIICLFYDNPEAGSVYHRLGFKSIDKWMMISVNSDTTNFHDLSVDK